ncbi:MAG: ABC transporter permease [Woeseiaceae bacterium]|nr:ABC transporter permease [Woeseiaceae bacterium]
MGTIFTVFLKEVLDNFRDKRTLGSALIMGPIFGPILFAVVINISIERSLESAERTLELPVIGEEYAPNMVAYLRSRNIDAIEGPENLEAAMEAVKTGEHDVVLVIPPGIGEELADMIPATVRLVSDQANTDADRDARRVRGALYGWNQELAAVRVVGRGINPMTLRPLNIDEVDVSTPSGRSAMLLGMMSYFFVFAALMGGMYLAIDTTAGERERGSLEPLLSLPVTRDQLIIGKIGATCLFMTLSLLLSLTAFYFVLDYMPLQQLGMTPNFGIDVVVKALLLFLPFILLGAALMTLVASFTKSYREAQTWLNVLLIAPTLPILIVSILTLRPRTEFMFIPSLSQHLLLVDMVKNEPVNGQHVAISVLSTLVIGGLLTWVCARLYRREGLLG